VVLFPYPWAANRTTDIDMSDSTFIQPLGRLAARLLGLVYNNRCPSCGKRADSLSTFPLCRACISSVSGYHGPACRQCAKPFASRYSHTCGDCLSDPPAFDRALSYGLYEGILMESVNLMKFRGARRLARRFGHMLSTLDIPGDADMILPVPMTGAALRKRGFNQSALMADTLGQETGVPLRLHMLRKVKETPPQVGLSRLARMKNLRGAFRAEPGVKGLRIIILDDVITTGATMRECAMALRKAGAAEVIALSIARTY